MWEEDPRWQQANYRLLVWTVVIGVVGGFVFSLWSGDWQPYRGLLEFLGVILAALCIYAAVIWTVGHLALTLPSVLMKLRHKDDDAEPPQRRP
jgi:uncharacterized membrane protein YjjP (DUF1212 family)